MSSPPLFESREAPKGAKLVHRAFAASVFAGLCCTWIYRASSAASGLGRWAWNGMFAAELVLGFHWICCQAVRWNLTRYSPLPHLLSQRFTHEEELPAVDVFVCTADPVIEPPTLVVNTVLSVMSYNYPTRKLAVYLSDDGCSELTFYALHQASQFAKHWIPFCKRHNIEPRSPDAYFDKPTARPSGQEWESMKKLYEEMKSRIETMAEKGSVPPETRSQHKGFLQWSHHNNVTKRNHQSIVEIVIDGREEDAVDEDGDRLPTLVYVAREKRPQFHHNFKAGAMNALIRASTEMSNGAVILNLDCDMFSNDPDAIRDALCFFLDEQSGHRIAFVQHPQQYFNVTKNDLYGNSPLQTDKVELAGMGGYGAALYIGTGCFHRREALCGNKGRSSQKTANELEEASKVLVSCSYEEGTQWGKEIGLVYGCPVEDVVTGMKIQCNGWKSIYYRPQKEAAFLGVAPNTLEISLIQHKRWAEGLFQIFLSSYCPLVYGHKRLPLGAQLGYCTYLLWAATAFPTLCYLVLAPLCLLQGIPLFPQVSSPWFIPFAYVYGARTIYSLVEGLMCGYTVKGWWNLQRVVLLRRSSSYVFSFVDTVAKQLGLSKASGFAVTAKVVTEDVRRRYEEEVMEFGSSSTTFIIVATVAMVNLFGLVGGIGKWWWVDGGMSLMGLQFGLCSVVVGLNLPVYVALFFRRDDGCLPVDVMFKAVGLASLAACLMAI
ncbi:unnamed protein product [Linum tenue]|uniref:Cellulose synthase-like protein E6 n=1 Tax=Linum tenue TaxID=586396 RepID=A0AAV0LTP8_9ROSI|nr:unnamed protein product [Linum tenue]